MSFFLVVVDPILSKVLRPHQREVFHLSLIDFKYLLKFVVLSLKGLSELIHEILLPWYCYFYALYVNVIYDMSQIRNYLYTLNISKRWNYYLKTKAIPAFNPNETICS